MDKQSVLINSPLLYLRLYKHALLKSIHICFQTSFSLKHTKIYFLFCAVLQHYHFLSTFYDVSYVNQLKITPLTFTKDLYKIFSYLFTLRKR